MPSPIAWLRHATQPLTSPQSNADLPASKDSNNAAGAWLQARVDAGLAWLKRGNPLARIGIVLLFFVLYVAVSIAYALRQKPDLKGYVSGSLVFGLPVAAFGLHASLIEPIAYGLAWSALGFGLFYAALAWLLYRRGRDGLRLLAGAFAALAVIFASLAIPLAFDRQTTTAMWAIEGAGLL